MEHFAVNLLAEHQGGHYLGNYTGYQNARRGVWRPCFDVQAKMVAFEQGDANALNDVTALQRGKCAMNATGGHNSDFWIEKADFWKLRQVALTYDLPEQWINRWASRASITLAGSNLFLWSDWSGSDPETEDFLDRAESGIYDGLGDYGRREYYSLPSPRSYLLSLRLTF